MARFSAPVLFVLGLLVVGAVAGVTYGVASYLDLGDGTTATTVGTPTTAAPAAPTTSQIAPNQLRVSGFVSTAAFLSIPYDTLSLPLTVTTPERGLGAGARITQVVVAGAPATITWDAGRPFVLGAGPGAIDVGLANLALEPGVARLGLPDDAVHTFAPGTYTLTTPVAVQTDQGLAEARDVVTFTATEESAVVFRGGASTDLDPAVAHQVLGPGSLQLVGDLEVHRPGLSQPVRAAGVSLADGEFDLTFTPAPGGWTVEGILEGDAQVS